MRLVKLAVAAVVALAVLVVGGTFVYIHFIEGPAPARLTLDSSGSTTTVAPSAGPATGIDGTWKATTSGTQAGYRAKEVLFGQDAEAVGRTDQVTGQLTVSGTTVSAAKVVVDLTTVKSDRSQRDGQFKGRIMDVSQFPTATFELTKPIDLKSTPSVNQTVQVSATGTLTVHGTTREVTVGLSARYDGTKISVQGDIPVKFSDYGIPDPTFGPATVQDHGEIEFLVNFTK